ncbi:hypothetical protein [Leptospira biflexa]|uniref:hypothetical protein n=1 Tax=Leptospira biflexa TaxID=172 RepID=UPI00108456E4|nr:hypothetical protein [Leptospira biflexa]TGM34784.1 hypothetical protein EHQ80_13600 [Leptospira biflexa]TGM42323.1 hypothetical protein EHQ89_00445 [Leptospira biflexa]
MNQDDKEVLKTLIKGGLLGAGLTALLKNGEADGEDLTIGAILGAAAVAAYQASQRAEKTDVPILVQEGDSLYWKDKSGNMTFFKKLPSGKHSSPSKFNLS